MLPSPGHTAEAKAALINGQVAKGRAEALHGHMASGKHWGVSLQTERGKKFWGDLGGGDGGEGGRIKATQGLILVDRGSKATLPLTIPRHVLKSSAKDFTRRSMGIIELYFKAAHVAHPSWGLSQRHMPLGRSGNLCSQVGFIPCRAMSTWLYGLTQIWPV